jgi:hypothetical protein
MRRMRVLAAIAAVALFGTTCSPNAGDMYPMSVGSVWKTELLVMSGTTIAALDTVETATTVTTAVEKANLASGEEVVQFKDESSIHTRTPDTTINSTAYSYTREDGDWILSYSALDDSTGDTIMVTTPAEGKTWHQGSATAEVVGQEDVTVKAGTYKQAWKVKVTGSQGVFTVDVFFWYARGVGLVKSYSEFEYQNYGQVYNRELTSASIK